jgi:hypothetical protein
MKEFFKKHQDHVLRYWERKRMWTPYDMECKDPEQLEYGDVECNYGYMVEVYDIGNDWLIGFSETREATYVEYHKLSDIELAYSDSDQEDEH